MACSIKVSSKRLCFNLYELNYLIMLEFLSETGAGYLREVSHFVGNSTLRCFVRDVFLQGWFPLISMCDMVTIHC